MFKGNDEWIIGLKDLRRNIIYRQKESLYILKINNKEIDAY